MNELTNNEILLKGNKIVIPQNLQTKTLQLAHMGHQGIVKTKSLLREKVWFLGIDKMVATLVQDCYECQMSYDTKQREPLKMSPLPNAEMCNWCIDFG
jgi:hypothetical protein